MQQRQGSMVGKTSSQTPSAAGGKATHQRVGPAVGAKATAPTPTTKPSSKAAARPASAQQQQPLQSGVAQSTPPVGHSPPLLSRGSSSRRGSQPPSETTSRPLSPFSTVQEHVGGSRHHHHSPRQGLVPLLSGGRAFVYPEDDSPQRQSGGSPPPSTLDSTMTPSAVSPTTTTVLSMPPPRRQHTARSEATAFGRFHCLPSDEDDEEDGASSVVVPWRQRCRVDLLLSRDTKNSGSGTLSTSVDVAAPPPVATPTTQGQPGNDGHFTLMPVAAPPSWAVDWFGTQIRRGGGAPGNLVPQTTQTSNEAVTATGNALSAQGGLVRADHVFLATTALASGRPCDALSVLESLAAMDPVFGTTERTLFHDAATAFIEKKRNAVVRANYAVKKRVEATSSSPTDGSSSTVSCAGQMLLRDCVLPDLIATVSRILRVVVHHLVPGSVAPARSTSVGSITYHKWILDWLRALCSTIIDAECDAPGVLEPLRRLFSSAPQHTAVVDYVVQHAPRTVDAARQSGGSGTTSTAASSPNQTGLRPATANHGGATGKGCLQSTLAFGSPYVTELLGRARTHSSVSTTSSAGGGSVVHTAECWSAAAVLQRVARLYARLAQDAQVLLPAIHALRVAVMVGALDTVTSFLARDDTWLHIARQTQLCGEGVAYELTLAVDEISSALNATATTKVQLHLLKRTLDSSLERAAIKLSTP